MPSTERGHVEGEDASAIRARRRRVLVAFGATAIALLPVVVTVVTRAGRHYLPIQDFGVLDLRVRDVWTSDIPLVGPYSRFGWNHPGPAMYWLIAPLSFVTGGAAWATLVGSALLQGAAIAITARVAWKLGGLLLVLGALAVQALAYSATGPWIFLQPWNPHAAYPYLPLFALLVWGIGLGAARYLPLAVFAGGFLVQTHVGYVPFVAVGIAWIVACAVLEVRREPSRQAAWRGRVLVWSAIVAVVMWLPVVIEQLQHGRRGNVAQLVKYFVGSPGEERTLGFEQAARLLAVEFRIPPPWLGGDTPIDALLQRAQGVSALWLMVAIGLFVVGFIAARRSGSRRALHAVVLSGALCLTGAVALSRVRGEPEAYLFYWRAPLAIMLVACSVAAIGTWLHLLRRARLAIFLVLGVLLAFPSLALAVDIARAPAHEAFEPTAQKVVDSLIGQRPQGPILFRHAGSTLLGLEGAIIDELDRRGVSVRVDDDREIQFGAGRTARPEDVREIWYTIEPGVYTSLLAARPDARVLAEQSPLAPAEEQELRRLQSELAGQLIEGGNSDQLSLLDSPLAAFALGDIPNLDTDALQRVAELNELVEQSGGCRCSVIAFPADVAVDDHGSDSPLPTGLGQRVP